MAQKMVMVNLNGTMDNSMKVNSIIIILKEQENIYGQMEDPMKDNGKITRCMEKELIYGQMEKNTLGNMLIIKKKDMVNFLARWKEL